MDKGPLTDIPSLGEVGQGVGTSLWDTTPNAFSAGRLVVKDGCSFHCVPGHRPQLTLPDGAIVKLRVKRYVPHLPHNVEDPDGIVEPASSDEHILANPEPLADGWDTGDEGVQMDDASTTTPPAPMAKLPEGVPYPSCHLR